MQPIRRAYEQLQRFTADASHELRAPLAAILQCSSRVNVPGQRWLTATSALGEHCGNHKVNEHQ